MRTGGVGATALVQQAPQPFLRAGAASLASGRPLLRAGLEVSRVCVSERVPACAC